MTISRLQTVIKVGNQLQLQQ